VGESFTENAAVPPQIAGDEELTVEGIIENVQQISSTSDYMGENGSPVGIDVAIVRCIERYGIKINFKNIKIL